MRVSLGPALLVLLVACTGAPVVVPPGGETSSTTPPASETGTTAPPTQTPSTGASATIAPSPPSTSEEPGPVGSNPPASSIHPPTPAPSGDDEPAPRDSPGPTDESGEPSLPPGALGFALIANRLFIFTESLLCSVDDDALRVIVHTDDGAGQMVIQWLFDGSIRGPFSITDADAGVTWQAGPTFLGTENPQFFITASTVTFNGPMRATSGLGGEGKLEHANLRVTCP